MAKPLGFGLGGEGGEDLGQGESSSSPNPRSLATTAAHRVRKGARFTVI